MVRLTALLALASTVGLAQGIVTGSSAIKRCSNGDKDCVETLTINLDISAGENGLEEILVKQAADAGASKSLAKAIKLSFYMEKPVLKYDLTYFTDFNAE